jgi:hypothetical protein
MPRRSDGKIQALSLKQVASCENAVTPRERCRCRCNGEHHGVKRVGGLDRAAYEGLPEGDPHKLPEPRQRRLL